MSHIITSTVKIKDLASVEAALREFPGARLVRDKKEQVYYAGNRNKVDHVIQLDGCDYEIGLVKGKDNSYSLTYDFYGHQGRKLKERFGDNLSKLATAYNKHFISREALRKGWMTTKRTLPNGGYELLLTK